MYFNKKNIKSLIPFSSFFKHKTYPYKYIQNNTYVDVYMKWKKDTFFDSIEHIHKSLELKPILSLKNIIVSSNQGCIPISDVSKKGKQLGTKNIKVARFLRQYPSFFDEFIGPKYNLPWFRLTKRAIELDNEEKEVYRVFRSDIQDRLKKVILMSGEKKVDMKVIKGLQWNLGLPDEYIDEPEKSLDECFRVVEMEDGLKGLSVENDKNKVFSVFERNLMRRGVYNGENMENMGNVMFPLFPSKGLRIKQKILDWMDEFSRVPYVSPYEDYSCLRTDSDISEKRVVGVIHELLSLFVENAAERKNFLFLKKCIGLPQKVHKAFERHPLMFYLSLRNKTCTAILKEAYCDDSAIEPHPLLEVRKKYISLMKESRVILRNRRVDHGPRQEKELPKLDLDDVEDENNELEEDCL